MTTTLHIKTDKKVKERAEKFAKHYGLTLTALVNLSLHQTLEQGQLNLNLPEVPNKKTARELKQMERDIKAGRNLVGPFTSAEEMDAYLKAA